MTTKQVSERESWSKRPYFTPRQLLSARQLNAGLDDELYRQRFLNRAIHGYGVVFGFAPKVRDDGSLWIEDGCIELSCGLALDRHGRMLHWPGGRVGIKDLEGKRPDCEGKYTLCVHYAERPPLADGCLPFSSDDSKWRGQGVVFTLRLDCALMDRCCSAHPEGSCIGHDEFLYQRTGSVAPYQPGRLPPSPDIAFMCADAGPLCPTDCGRWLYDPSPDVCVPLDCYEICDLANEEPDYPEPPDTYGSEGEQLEQPTDEEPKRPPKPAPNEPDCEPDYGFCEGQPLACDVRPFVYRNPLLYELSNCCDVELPRVKDISWQDWTKDWNTAVPWGAFAAQMNPTSSGFAITFSRPVEIATLHQASIKLTAIYKERRSDYWVPQEVPLADLMPIDPMGGLASGVRLVPEDEWLAAEVTGNNSTLFSGARFELTIRGQLLRDECGNMLDARPIDVDCSARCQSRPGGDFTSVFQVDERRPYKDDPYAS